MIKINITTWGGLVSWRSSVELIYSRLLESKKWDSIFSVKLKVFLRKIFVSYKEINHQVRSYSEGILSSVHVGGKSAIQNNPTQVLVSLRRSAY